ncbi:hypothetical protein [Reyranella sp.]|uniref:hypothetical protein n=1 Tax=Reyranella sp. TaxID=1929291 RepID=UPI003D0E9D2D
MVQQVRKSSSTRRLSQTAFGTWLARSQQGDAPMSHRGLSSSDHSIYGELFTGRIRQELNHIYDQECLEWVL